MSADIHGLVGAYAVDAVDDDERAAFEAHLAECPECRAEVASLREAAGQLGLLAETAPPTGMRAAVLSRVGTVRPLPPLADDLHAAPSDASRPAAPHLDAPTHLVPVPAPAADAASQGRRGPEDSGDRAVRSTDGVVVPLRRRRALTWLAGAAAAVALVVGGLVWSPWSDNAPSTRLTATERVLEAKDAQRFVKVIDGARATIVRSPSMGRAVLIADNMPAAPDGKDFQVWFDQPGKGMQSALVMPHGSAPTVTVMLEGDATTATGAGITLEPAGGSPEPTSAPLALFSFS